MNGSGALRSAVLAVGWITVASGLGQLFMPGVVLGLLNAERSATSAHFFAIVGMFMALFGGLMVSSVRLPDELARGPLLWCGLQKVGACLAVGVGVGRGVFAALALGVAGFDLLSALAVFAYRRRLAR